MKGRRAWERGRFSFTLIHDEPLLTADHCDAIGSAEGAKRVSHYHTLNVTRGSAEPG